MQFELPNELTATVRKDHVIEEDVTDWPQTAKDKIWVYGFQQLINDAAAPAKKTWKKDETPTDAQLAAYNAEVDSFVTKRLDNLRNGVLRASPIRTGNPVAVEARSIALKKVTVAWTKKYGKLVKDDRDEFNAKVAELAARPDIVAMAEANVAAAAELDVDIEV